MGGGRAWVPLFPSLKPPAFLKLRSSSLGPPSPPCPAPSSSRRLQGVGVDAPLPDDAFYRLRVERAFFVGGLFSSKMAEEVAELHRHLHGEVRLGFAKWPFTVILIGSPLIFSMASSAR